MGKRATLLSGNLRAIVCSDFSGSESSSDAFSSVPKPPEVPVKPCKLLALPFVLRSNTAPDCPLCVSLASTLSADKKDSDYDMPFLWFLDSLQSNHVDRVLFQQYINLDTKSHHSLQIAERDVKTDGVFDAAESWVQLRAMFDMQHPYWKHRKIFLRSSGGNAVMFVSACQYHVDLGLQSADQCIGQAQWGDSLDTQTRISVIHAITKNIIPRMREQHEQLDKQQRIIEKLSEEIRSLHSTVDLIADQMNLRAKIEETSQNLAT